MGSGGGQCHYCRKSTCVCSPEPKGGFCPCCGVYSFPTPVCRAQAERDEARTRATDLGHECAKAEAEVDRLRAGIRTLGDHLYTLQGGLVWLREEANQDISEASSALCCVVSMVGRDGPRWDGNKPPPNLVP